jgi:hypothetical protein
MQVFLFIVRMAQSKQHITILNWDKEHNINLRKQSEIYGEAFELNYVNTDGEFAATILTPLEAYVLGVGTTF